MGKDLHFRSTLGTCVAKSYNSCARISEQEKWLCLTKLHLISPRKSRMTIIFFFVTASPAIWITEKVVYESNILIMRQLDLFRSVEILTSTICYWSRKLTLASCIFFSKPSTTRPLNFVFQFWNFSISLKAYPVLEK